jgi:hypothetical protein
MQGQKREARFRPQTSRPLTEGRAIADRQHLRGLDGRLGRLLSRTEAPI